MAPGDTVYGALRVRNAGSLALRYSMSATADNLDAKGLRNQLDFSVYRGVTAANCDAGASPPQDRRWPARHRSAPLAS